MYRVFLGFKHGQLITIILSRLEEVEDAIDCTYYIPASQQMKQQIQQWIQNTNSKKT